NAGLLRQFPHARGRAVDNINGDEITALRLRPTRYLVFPQALLQNILHGREFRRENARMLAHNRTHALSGAKVLCVRQLVELIRANPASISNGHVPIQVLPGRSKECYASTSEGDLRGRRQNPESIWVTCLFSNS